MVKDLRTFPMLAELKDGELEKLSGLMREEIFPAGSRIIEEGDVGNTMYFLLEGTVEILKTTLYGEEYVCATLIDEYSCVFGEIALIDHDRRSATVRAKNGLQDIFHIGGRFSGILYGKSFGRVQASDVYCREPVQKSAAGK